MSEFGGKAENNAEFKLDGLLPGGGGSGGFNHGDPLGEWTIAMRRIEARRKN
jgi:hypothetical protein